MISQFEPHQYMDLIHSKKFPVLQKVSNSNNISNLLQKKILEQQQDLNELGTYISHKYLRVKTSSYMTPQRIQAMYNCEVDSI